MQLPQGAARKARIAEPLELPQWYLLLVKVVAVVGSIVARVAVVAAAADTVAAMIGRTKPLDCSSPFRKATTTLPFHLRLFLQEQPGPPAKPAMETSS